MTITWLFVALLAVGHADPTPGPSVEPTTTDNSDLNEEGQDQVAILKQINRVNEDGSYTFGYEAADGSFKIETRDVAGNVKGMFGFVDEGGELRRVSYSASNGTGFQSTGAPNIPPIVTPGDIESTTRINLLPSSTTEKPLLPVYIYGSSTTTARPTQPEVIQHIPKLRPTPASLSTEPTEAEEITTERRPTYGSLLPRKSATPNYITLRTTTAAVDDEEENVTRRPSAVQLIRPRVYKKIVVTKRPVDQSTTAAPPVTTTFYPVHPLPDDDTSRGYQREIDANSLTEPGLAVSSTEDSPDVYGGGPGTRPFPVGAYRNAFPAVPQYQRILQSAYLQNQNPYISNPVDPRVQQQATGPLPVNQYFGQGVGRYPLNPDIINRYQDPSQIPGGQPYGPIQGVPSGYPSGQGATFQYSSGQPDALNYGPIQGGPLPYPQSPRPFPVGGQPPQGAPGQSGPSVFPQPVPPVSPPNLPRPTTGQTLPTPSYNPAQGLVPKDTLAKPGEPVQRPIPIPPQPPGYNQAYPNVPPYGPEQANSQMFFMEQIIRMLLAAQAQQQPQSQYQQQQPPPYQQLSPFQQALISVLGPNNIPPDFIGRNYDPRYYSPGPFQQRNPYDPRYQPPFSNPYFGHQDPYSLYRPQFNPYYQANPYAGLSPNPYYQGNPQEALLRMFLGAQRYPAPVPQSPIPQIQQSPAAFDRSQPLGPREPVESDIPAPSSPVFGRRIPISGNIVERSPVYSKTTTPSTRSKGSRNVQIIDEGTNNAEVTSTTAKPR